MDNKIYSGRIKTTNGVFGFIESELGETFFHKKGFKSEFYPQKNDEIEFQIEPSKKKQGELQACEIVLIKKGEDDEMSKDIDNRLIGVVKWYNASKGYGIIGTPEGIDYFLRKADLQSKSISAGNVVVFLGKNKSGKNIAIKCRHTFGYKDWKLAFSYAAKDDIVTVEFVIEKEKDWGYGTYRYTEKQGISIISNTLNRLLKQRESLSEFELHMLSLNLLQTKFANEGYVLIKEIVLKNNLKNEDKKIFLKSAFEKATAKYQYKILFEDNLIDIQKETTESQIELLQRIERLDIDKIKSIAQSDKIEETVKDAFLKSEFEKASTENQYKMVFEDNLIDIQKETTESQIELLQKIERIDIDKIKSIAQSDKIEETVKNAFLKSEFEKANTENQYKMLFEGLVVLSAEDQSKFLEKYLLDFGRITYSNYDRIKSIAQSDKIEETIKAAFLTSAFERATLEYQYKMLFDGLIILSDEQQIKLLRIYILELDKVSYSNYDRIKSFALLDKIEETVKDAVLKFAFENINGEYQYKMLLENNIINIQKETPESQIELLRKFKRLDIDKINSIYKSDKIEETVKIEFLKTAFEKASPECQYKMLFEHKLIDIQKETTERQIEFLRKFERLDIDSIKSIAQSDKIDEAAKDTFLKSIFEKVSAVVQIKIINDDSLINGVSKKLEFLLLATKSSESNFSKPDFSYLYLLENNIEYLHKNIKKQGSNIREFYDIVIKQKKGKMNLYGNNMYSYHDYKLSTTYINCKQVWCSILVEIYRALANQELFINDKTKEVLVKITRLGEIRKLYEIFKIDFDKTVYDNCLKYAIEQLDFNFIEYVENYQWLACVKKYNLELYTILFEKNYAKISKFDRLQLWLNNLNLHYNYLELVQSAWQLTNDQKKLFNKRVKEHAKEERLQKFFDQIPIAELIDETETTKTYKCKWRNLYYKNGSIQVFFDKTTSSEDYLWESAREEWNLLTQEYFNNRRIDDIITMVDNFNHISKITGLEDIEVKIIIAEVRKNGTTERKTSISSSQILRIIHNISARNQCINFLACQNSDYNVLDIQELVTDDYGSLRRDVSFIFPIPNGKGKVYLIWESAEFEKSKATHIFKCASEELEDMEFKIKDFIESNLRTRSRLNSVEFDDLKVKKELQYFCRVNHDSVEYQVWEHRMKEVLPFLK
jgi:cold shock CspA family protein